MKTLKGYIFSRSFLDERVPQKVQNLVLRDYCKKNNYNFLLSATEYNFGGSSIILNQLVNNLSKKIDGIVAYSLYQLPKDTNLRKKILKKILTKNKEIHFALEELTINDDKGIDIVENYWFIKIQSLNSISKNDFKLVNFFSDNHNSVTRDYFNRMSINKINEMKISKKFDFDYWDGDRKFGYGGYKYIKGRNDKIVKNLIKKFKLTSSSRIIDLGCGKGYLLYDLSKALGSKNVVGLDISKYAIKNSQKNIKDKLHVKDLRKKLSYFDKEFDLALSINLLHNFKLNEIDIALKEMMRISKNQYICVESFRNEKEQFNLQCWALTAETIIGVDSWNWIFDRNNYSGLKEFIYFV